MLGRHELYTSLERAMRSGNRNKVEETADRARQLGWYDLHWLGTGWLRLAEGNHTEAIFLLRRAHAVDGISIVILDTLAQALAADGSEDESMRLWETVMLRGNEVAKAIALSRRAQVYLKMRTVDRWEEGISSLYLSLTFHAEQPYTWLQLARALAARGQEDDLRRVLEEANRLMKDEDARLATAKLLGESSDLQVDTYRMVVADAIAALETPPEEATTPVTEAPWLSYAHLASVAAGEGEFRLAGSRLATALTLANAYDIAAVIEAFAAGRSKKEVEETMASVTGRQVPSAILQKATEAAESLEWRDQ